MGNRVTIVVPVYNTKKYLEECVSSITAQTFKDIEILLIDDGSTDGSSELCDEISERDSRARVIHKANGGAATARNLGMDEAKGEYVMFLDSDDWLSTDAIETLVRHADEHKTDVIRFNYVREFEGKQLVKRNTFLEERVYSGDECLNVCRQVLGLSGEELSHPESMNFLASCGFNMYRKDVLKKSGERFIPIQQVGSFVDGLFNFGVFMYVKRFEFIDRPYYHYRKTNRGAVTAGYRRNYIPRQLALFGKLRNKIDEEKLWEIFGQAYNNRIVFSTMEIALNAMRNKASFFVKYKEVKSVLKHEVFKAAYKNFSLKHLDLKWKMYYFFIKHSMVFPTYVMTAVILKIKNKGVL